MGNPASVAQGPILIGTFLNVILYGIMITQTYMYFSLYRNDKLWLKCLVAFLLLADTLNSVFDMWWIYDIVINHFGDVAALEDANWLFATDPAMVGIIGTTVQLFFAWRVKVLTGSNWIMMLIVLSALGSICGGIGTSIAIHFVPSFIDFQRFSPIVIVWLITAAVCDIAISVALTWYLRKNKTGFAATDDLVNRIIRLTMQNGLLTAVWAIVDLIAFLVDPSGLHLLFNFPLAKLYTNSLLSSLNSRAGWRYNAASESTEIRSVPAPGSREAYTQHKNNAHHNVVNLSTHLAPEVFVEVESHEMIDVADKRDIEWAAGKSRMST